MMPTAAFTPFTHARRVAPDGGLLGDHDTPPIAASKVRRARVAARTSGSPRISRAVGKNACTPSHVMHLASRPGTVPPFVPSLSPHGEGERGNQCSPPGLRGRIATICGVAHCASPTANPVGAHRNIERMCLRPCRDTPVTSPPSSPGRPRLRAPAPAASEPPAAPCAVLVPRSRGSRVGGDPFRPSPR
jgi:hypothetical protein